MEDDKELANGQAGQAGQANGATAVNEKSIELTEINGGDREDPPPSTHNLLYTIHDTPPWYLSLFLGLQHILMMVGATLSIPLIISDPLCLSNGDGPADEVGKSELISTIFMVSAVSTMLQTTLGVRLPIVQGGTFTLLAPTFAVLFAIEPCKTILPQSTSREEWLNMTMYSNDSNSVIAGSPEHREFWQGRMRVLQGSIMVASLFQMLIGFTGLIGVLTRFIGPVTVTPTITLVGLALFGAAGDKAGTQWGIAFLTVALIAICSEILKKVDVPCAGWSRGKGCHIITMKAFGMFPVIIAMVIAWIFVLILTESGAIPRDHPASTSRRVAVLEQAAWFRFPYPGQWGMPELTVAGVFGMLAGIMASMVESLGDYYAAARLSGAPPPPTHAINRGIGMEGIGSLLAGAWGSGNGTTSYSENIGAIGITRVGSVRVIQAGACMLFIISVLGKFSAVMVTIPDPVVGGMFIVMFSMVTAVGLANLQYVDLNATRNLLILGVSLMLGLSVPYWMAANPDAINTGSDIVDQIFEVLLKTSMFVGGVTACFLDNIFPGTVEERGIAKWNKNLQGGDDSATLYKCYDLPFGNDCIYRTKWLRYVPFLPSFQQKRTPEQP